MSDIENEKPYAPPVDVAIDASSDASDEVISQRSSRLQELARLVAKTVAERKAEGGEPEAEELADGTMALEQIEPEQMGFEALEEELDAADNDADPEPTEFVENDQLISIVESLLFSTDKPVSLATLKSLFKGTNVRTKDIARALDILASDYASATRGVTLEEINGGYQLRTKVDNTDFLKRLQKVRPFRLSGPALETMSIVAYKQPVTKYEIDEIRGVESGHLLRALMERGMIQFQGKAEDKPGKPMAYGSTRKFLETFGLRNLRELPTLSEIDELLPEGIGEVEEKESLSDITDELSNEFTGGYSENEEELSKINETLQAIDTSSEFFEQEKVRERERRDRDRAQDIRERIVLGDAVETKDQRWLDRYEAKLHAQDQAMSSGTPINIPGDEIENAEPIGDALEALTNESQAGAQKVASNDADDDLDEAEGSGDLSSNLDWDDDSVADDEDTSNDV
jgi:segregation and condensation protein B